MLRLVRNRYSLSPKYRPVSVRGVHKTALSGFSDRNVRPYESGRPSYSNETMEKVISILRECNGLKSYPFFVELGAGTGKFTRCLNPQLHQIWNDFFKLVVVEPAPGFYNFLKEDAINYRNVTVAQESADKLSVSAGSINGILAAQAFHWFAKDETMLEMNRVLMKGMPVILVWNTYDYRKSFMRQLDEIFIAPRYPADVPRQQNREWEKVFDAGRPASKLFSPRQRSISFFKMDCTKEMIISRVLSTSVIAELPENQQKAIRNDVLEFIRTHPDSRGIADEGLYPMHYESEVVWFNKNR